MKKLLVLIGIVFSISAQSQCFQIESILVDGCDGGNEGKNEMVRFKEPLIKLRKEFPHIIISVDTYLAEVADMAISLGADIINDISGGTLDDKMIDLVAKNDIPYIMMHMQGTPQTMQENPTYKNVVTGIPP